MEGLELDCFQIISLVGVARSDYIEAISEAANGNFDQAANLVTEGDESFNKGHVVHAKLIQQEAGGTHVDINLLLLHAEDMLMSAETFKIIALQQINVYKQIKALQESQN